MSDVIPFIITLFFVALRHLFFAQAFVDMKGQQDCRNKREKRALLRTDEERARSIRRGPPERHLNARRSLEVSLRLNRKKRKRERARTPVYRNKPSGIRIYAHASHRKKNAAAHKSPNG